MISRALLVLAICASIPTLRAQQPCLNAPQNPHSFAASPISCAHYTLCLGGNTIVGDDLVCQGALLFDPVTQTCGQTSCLECSPFGLQNLPHPDNCYQYVECILGHREIRTCPNGLLFDRTVSQCNQAFSVYCPGEPTTNPWDTTTNPWDTTTNPSDTTTNPWDTTTNPWDTTTNPWVTTTPPPIGTTAPSPLLPTCLGGQVYHAHPSECTRFFVCINTVLWSFTCPNNLYWNQVINTCDLPEYAGCIHQGGGGVAPPGIPTDPPLFPPVDTTISPWATEPNVYPPNPVRIV